MRNLCKKFEHDKAPKAGKIMDITTKKINKAQEEWYQNGELEVLNGYFKRYSVLIEEMRTKSNLTILDTGEGQGIFQKNFSKKCWLREIVYAI